eukprot:scaffold24646_cov129-Isochrysis_galbana.AAC.6
MPECRETPRTLGDLETAEPKGQESRTAGQRGPTCHPRINSEWRDTSRPRTLLHRKLPCCRDATPPQPSLLTLSCGRTPAQRSDFNRDAASTAFVQPRGQRDHPRSKNGRALDPSHCTHGSAPPPRPAGRRCCRTRDS